MGISTAHLNTIIVGVFTGAAYALVAISVTLMFRSTGVLSFAHAAFAAMGAYLYADLAGNRGWPRPLAALAALAVTVAYGLVVERFAIRPVRHAGSATRLMATVGVLSLTTGLLLQFFGFEPTAAPLLLPDVNVAVGSLRLPLQQIAILTVAGAGAVGLGIFLVRTRFGSGVRAVAENPEAARLMGVSLTRVARFNWALGAAMAGMAGILIAPLQILTGATFPLLLTKALAATLFGGLVSLPLTFAGGLVIGVVESLTTFHTSVPGRANSPCWRSSWSCWPFAGTGRSRSARPSRSLPVGRPRAGSGGWRRGWLGSGWSWRSSYRPGRTIGPSSVAAVCSS